MTVQYIGAYNIGVVYIPCLKCCIYKLVDSRMHLITLDFLIKFPLLEQKNNGLVVLIKSFMPTNCLAKHCLVTVAMMLRGLDFIICDCICMCCMRSANFSFPSLVRPFRHFCCYHLLNLRLEWQSHNHCFVIMNNKNENKKTNMTELHF